MTEKITLICDECHEEITEREKVDARNYGVHFHKGCFRALTPFELLRHLGLDDVRSISFTGESYALIYQNEADWR